MPKTETADPIEQAPLSDSLRTLARRGVISRLRKGVQIITEGDRGDSLFILLSGRLRAYSVGADDKEITYGVYGPGEYVGEMGLDGGPRSASVETLEPSICALVTRRTLEQHLAAEPNFAFELISRVIRRARAATLGLRNIALHGVYGQLKALLETQAQGQLPFIWDPAPSHKEIGQLLGCTSAMVTIVMADLKRAGCLRVARRRIVLVKELPSKW